MTYPVPGPLPAPLTHYGADPAEVFDSYIDVVTRHINRHPRSLQKQIGPSEVGTPCARKVGYKLLGHPEQPRAVNWKATLGTAAHAWMEGAFDADNVAGAARLDGQERWLVETRLTVGYVPALGFITGHSDLYDRVTATNLDHKFVGPSQLRHYRKDGPGTQYKAQAHLYGQGWINAGYPCERVGIVFLPRQGELSEAHMWTEPFNPAAAEWALRRLGTIAGLTKALGDAALGVLETADDWCSHCPFQRFGSDDLAVACPGDPSSWSTRPQTPALSFGDPEQPTLT